MRRIFILGSLTGSALVASAVAALQAQGHDVASMSESELADRVVKDGPADFSIYAPEATATPQPRFNGYMGKRRRRW